MCGCECVSVLLCVVKSLYGVLEKFISQIEFPFLPLTILSLFTMMFISYTNLTWDLFLAGGIVFITYICEYHWIYPHSGKEYSRDLFMFVCLLFFLVAYYTMTPVKDLTLLSRDQTEEWKGWMQFIFLLYHYFHAEEVYNSVRVMITCYVWMTGFGNFSFFYIKQDFGWLRYVQMLWRLNFSVILLMFAHNNTYILYYICPLHTFYFTLVYVTMFIMSSVNHSKWGMRFKLFGLGCLIYVVWDINGRFFNLFWGWMSTDTIIGAKLGSLWEWYFRSSLDHYSTYFGMIFALNFPLAEQYFHSARGYPLYFASVVMGGLAIWWYNNIYSLEKLEYNLVHNYFAFIPLTAYIFFRNISPGIRSKVSMSLHALGKTTLETYLLQHHVWLTSNAKTLLTIVPDMPWVNFFLATLLFYTLSKELYRLTMTLRGMILPDNGTLAARNLIGGIVLSGMAYVVAAVVFYSNPTLFSIFLACLFCFLMLTLVIRKRSIECKVSKNFEYTWRNMFICCAILLVLGAMSASLFETTDPTSNGTTKVPTVPVLTKRCKNMATSGHWVESSSCGSDSKSAALCTSSKWEWQVDPSCPFHLISPSDGASMFKNKKILFLGDSQSRSVFHAFNRLVSKDYVENSVVRHGDLSNHNEKLGIDVDFLWTPFLRNVTTSLKQNCNNDRANFYVVSATLWDALHFHNLEEYKKQLGDFINEVEICNAAKTNKAKGKVIWLSPPPVIDSRLNTPEKLMFMTESKVDEFRHLAESNNVNLRDVVVSIINPSNVTRGKESTSTDGVHYGVDVYNVLAEIVANIFSADNGLVAKNTKSAKKNPYPNGKPTGSMSDPKLGFGILVLSAIMIFGWDSWLGIGMVSLWLFGIKPDWERAYRPLLDKIKPEPSIDDDETDGLIEMEAK